MLSEFLLMFGAHKDTLLIGLSLHLHLGAVWVAHRKLSNRVSKLETVLKVPANA